MGKQFVGAELGVAHTNPQTALGTVHEAANGSVYMYLQADGAVTKELLYVYDQTDGQITEAADAAVDPADSESAPLCISPVTLADNEYVWAFVGPGSATCNSDGNGVTADAICYVSATAGKFSSTATAALLKGVRVDTTIGASTTGTLLAVNRLWSEDLP